MPVKNCQQRWQSAIAAAKAAGGLLTRRVLSGHDDYPPDGLSITEPDVRGGGNSVTLRYAQDSISGDYVAEASAEATAEQARYDKLHRDIYAPLVHMAKFMLLISRK